MFRRDRSRIPKCRQNASRLVRPVLHAPHIRGSHAAKIGGGPAGFPPSPLGKHQPACKPGSVGREADAPRVTAIPLRRRLLGASSDLPGRPDPDIDPEACAPRRPYSVLLPVGFAVPPALPPPRCALTAPFHPCLLPGGAQAVYSLWHFP